MRTQRRAHDCQACALRRKWDSAAGDASAARESARCKGGEARASTRPTRLHMPDSHRGKCIHQKLLLSMRQGLDVLPVKAGTREFGRCFWCAICCMSLPWVGAPSPPFPTPPHPTTQASTGKFRTPIQPLKAHLTLDARLCLSESKGRRLSQCGRVSRMRRRVGVVEPSTASPTLRHRTGHDVSILARRVGARLPRARPR